jgi:hypothetical protein
MSVLRHQPCLNDNGGCAAVVVHRKPAEGHDGSLKAYGDTPPRVYPAGGFLQIYGLHHVAAVYRRR